jgi:hypothetical protein
VLKRELMTSFLNSGATNPLSRLTIATLEDLGYAVRYDTADLLTLGDALGVHGDAPRQHSVLLPATGVIDDTK